MSNNPALSANLRVGKPMRRSLNHLQSAKQIKKGTKIIFHFDMRSRGGYLPHDAATVFTVADVYLSVGGEWFIEYYETDPRQFYLVEFSEIGLESVDGRVWWARWFGRWENWDWAEIVQ